MSKPEVRKVGLDWYFDCPEHNEVIWCDSWEAAMEAFWGHVIMCHISRSIYEERERLRELARRFRG